MINIMWVLFVSTHKKTSGTLSLSQYPAFPRIHLVLVKEWSHEYEEVLELGRMAQHRHRILCGVLDDLWLGHGNRCHLNHRRRPGARTVQVVPARHRGAVARKS